MPVYPLVSWGKTGRLVGLVLVSWDNGEKAQKKEAHRVSFLVTISFVSWKQTQWAASLSLTHLFVNSFNRAGVRIGFLVIVNANEYDVASIVSQDGRIVPVFDLADGPFRGFVPFQFNNHGWKT